MSGFDVASAAKYLVIGLLGLLVLSPCIAILWKGTNLRRSLWRAGCWRWVICCDSFYGEGVSSADFVERQNGALTVVAYYQLAFAEREERNSGPGLRLETWRESLHSHGPAGPPTRLEEIKIMDERMEREEPLVLPQRSAVDADTEVKRQANSKQGEYQPPSLVLAPPADPSTRREDTGEEMKSDHIV